TLYASSSWVRRWIEVGADTSTGTGDGFVDSGSLLENNGLYFSHREHRVTASGVWELPGRGRRDLVGMLIGGWSVAPVFIYQSGQPWTMPNNVDLAVDPAVAALPGEKDGQFIYGV